MNYDDDELSQACLQSEHFRNKYKNVIHTKRRSMGHSFNAGQKPNKFQEYMDKMNVKIDSKDINKPREMNTLRHEAERGPTGQLLNRTTHRIATAVPSPYRDDADKVKRLRPLTVKHQIWKSAGRPRLFGRKKPVKNIIAENIRNVRKLNNINLLNKIDNEDVTFTKLNVHEKAKLLKTGVERGDDFIIFKRRNTKRKRFNEPKSEARKQKRTLS